jgi:hypothetical protein
MYAEEFPYDKICHGSLISYNKRDFYKINGPKPDRKYSHLTKFVMWIQFLIGLTGKYFGNFDYFLLILPHLAIFTPLILGYFSYLMSF